MERQFFSGNTLEQAVMAAARHYGVEPERVAYTLRDKKHGFLNIRRRVVIEVDPAAPKKQFAELGEPPSGPEPAATHEPLPSHEPPARDPSGVHRAGRTEGGHDEDPDDVPGGQEGVKHHLRALDEEFEAECDGAEEREEIAFLKALKEVVALAGLRLEKAAVVEHEGVYQIEVSGTDSRALVADDGELLRAIEHLLPRLVRGFLGHGRPCKVDSEGFRASRDLELRELAGGLAELVRLRGEPQELEPMAPADRRIVHLALAEDPTVRTESEGRGFLKKVRIFPA